MHDKLSRLQLRVRKMQLVPDMGDDTMHTRGAKSSPELVTALIEPMSAQHYAWLAP